MKFELLVEPIRLPVRRSLRGHAVGVLRRVLSLRALAGACARPGWIVHGSGFSTLGPVFFAPVVVRASPGGGTVAAFGVELLGVQPLPCDLGAAIAATALLEGANEPTLTVGQKRGTLPLFIAEQA